MELLEGFRQQRMDRFVSGAAEVSTRFAFQKDQICDSSMCRNQEVNLKYINADAGEDS